MKQENVDGVALLRFGGKDLRSRIWDAVGENGDVLQASGVLQAQVVLQVVVLEVY